MDGEVGRSIFHQLGMVLQHTTRLDPGRTAFDDVVLDTTFVVIRVPRWQIRAALFVSRLSCSKPGTVLLCPVCCLTQLALIR